MTRENEREKKIECEKKKERAYSELKRERRDFDILLLSFSLSSCHLLR